MIRLRALGWDHPRCMDPMRAAARAWTQQTPGVEVVWEPRSGDSFAYEPLEAVTARCDIVSFDHPHVGSAARSGCLLAFDDLLAPEALDALAHDSIGLSHASYAWEGRQWGLATDAAAQVSVVRDDLLKEWPKTWSDALALAKEASGRVTTSLSGADALCALLTLLANRGTPVDPTPERFADPDTALPALEWLAAYAEHCHPTAYDGYVVGPMSQTDDIVYGLLQWSYTNPCRAGFAAKRLRFADIPSAGHGPIGSTLGGAGLGISASSEHPHEAAAFAAWASGAEAQGSIVLENAGQPGSLAVWDDPRADEVVGGFFSATRATMDGAQLRPRDAWFPALQEQGGHALARGLRERQTPEAILAEIERIYQAACAAETTRGPA